NPLRSGTTCVCICYKLCKEERGADSCHCFRSSQGYPTASFEEAAEGKGEEPVEVLAREACKIDRWCTYGRSCCSKAKSLVEIPSA
nr:hypothetical protein [Tanacetum cinerariifolium]